MATNSILKNVEIKDQKHGKALVTALESAAGKKSKEVQLRQTYEDISGENLRSLFGR